MISKYKAGGALTEADTDIYVKRSADQYVFEFLNNMDYVMIIEPRKQGKTSLVNLLNSQIQQVSKYLIYIDATSLSQTSSESWYASLSKRILRQIRFYFPLPDFQKPTNFIEWREFLGEISGFLENHNISIVFAFDEIGAISFNGSSEFFSVLRDVYNSRQFEPDLRNITFLLIGSFHPQDLISDPKISPFNIARQVRLEDFSLDEITKLTKKGNWQLELSKELATRIHYWTDGQPYLTQLLLSYLEPNDPLDKVDDCIKKIRNEDKNLLPNMLRKLKGNHGNAKYLNHIFSGNRMKYFPAEVRNQFELELMGWIKIDGEGCCRIRNRIYESVLQDFFDFEDPCGKEVIVSQHLDTKEVTPVNRTLLREYIVDHFSLDELELLCIDIQENLQADGVQFKVSLDLLGSSGIPIRVQNLIDYLNRNGYLGYLLAALRKTRPGINTNFLTKV